MTLWKITHGFEKLVLLRRRFLPNGFLISFAIRFNSINIWIRILNLSPSETLRFKFVKCFHISVGFLFFCRFNLFIYFCCWLPKQWQYLFQVILHWYCKTSDCFVCKLPFLKSYLLYCLSQIISIHKYRNNACL